jgi:hypothetical protein
MSFCQILNAKQKALDLNLDHRIYGTLAEIGAGQEVARHFFQAGGAAGTVAKTICAYDMTMSDTIYGTTNRYVSFERLGQMLDHEYSLLNERLTDRDGKTQFFAFADTVQAKSYKGTNECHGWMGVSFQHSPKASVSRVILHVRMLDKENVQQQEALGLIGVNLIYGCFRHLESREIFVSSLMEGLTTERLEIDMISVEGPAFANEDSRLYSLELVKRRYCQAVMFDPHGKPLRAADNLYKKNLVILRGSFRPPTLVNLDMLQCGLKLFEQSMSAEDRKDIVVLPEISMSKLIERGEVDNSDFLARIDLLACLDQSVLISNCETYSELNSYLASYSKKRLAFVLGVYNLEDILSQDKYKKRSDGLLGALGELLGHTTELYVYPAADDDDATKLRTLESLNINEEIRHLYTYLLQAKKIREIAEYDESVSGIWSRTVLKMIQDGEAGWEKMLPPVVADLVKKKKLFGFKS